MSSSKDTLTTTQLRHMRMIPLSKLRKGQSFVNPACATFPIGSTPCTVEKIVKISPDLSRIHYNLGDFMSSSFEAQNEAVFLVIK